MVDSMEKIVALCKSRGYVYPGSEIYGGLANIVILMFWFYLLAYAFTIGMALNYRKEEVELEKTGTINKVN